MISYLYKRIDILSSSNCQVFLGVLRRLYTSKLMPGEINRLMLDDPPGDLGDVFWPPKRRGIFRYGRHGSRHI